MVEGVELVEKILVGGVRLSAKLRLETEKDDASVAVLQLHCSGFAFNCFRMEQKPAFKRVGLLGIASEHCTMKTWAGFEDRATLKHHDWLIFDAIIDGLFRMFRLHAKQRARTEELVALYTFKQVLHR